MIFKRIPCGACNGGTIRYQGVIRCRECSGLGYIEHVTIPKDCTQEQPNCPVFFDPMVNGWECRKCYASGPC